MRHARLRASVDLRITVWREDIRPETAQCETVFTKHAQAQPHTSDYTHAFWDLGMKTQNSAWCSPSQEWSGGGRQRVGSVTSPELSTSDS